MRKNLLSLKLNPFQLSFGKFLLLPILLSGAVLQAQDNPEWSWVKAAGGSLQDYAYRSVTDSDGNVYTIGSFISPVLNIGDTNLSNAGLNDVFIAKFDANGNAVWAKSAGGSDYDGGMDLALDSDGNVYVTGYFSSETIAFDNVILTNTDVGTSDFFTVKYNSNGEVQWAKSAGGTVGDASNEIKVDANGNAIITGYFGSAEMTFASTTLVGLGGMDIFIAKYDTNGNELWALNPGGVDFEQGKAVDVDADGNIYLSGFFSSSVATFGFLSINNSGINDIFLVKYDPNGVEQWAKSFGGSMYEGVESITVDHNSNVYITGYFASSTIDFGGASVNLSGTQNIFVTKLDTNGNAVWAKSGAGSGTDMGEGIAVDAGGNVYLSGNFDSSSLTFGDKMISNGGDVDGFLTKFDTDGNAVWAVKVGGSNADYVKKLSFDANGFINISGYFGSNSITIGDTTLNSNGSADFFVGRFAADQMGLNDFNSIADLNFYPNPTKGLIHFNQLDAKIQKIEVYNLMGQKVLVKNLNPLNSSTDLSQLENGVYTLKVESENGKVYAKKLIIRK